jgi:hypothetical protein
MNQPHEEVKRMEKENGKELNLLSNGNRVTSLIDRENVVALNEYLAEEFNQRDENNSSTFIPY